jgi:fatty acid desaturase
MAYQAQNTLRTAMPERDLVDRSAIGTLTRRSDLRGVMQLAAHAACLVMTAAIVWLAPFWYLLIPAMALHGVPIVTMFAPMHECVHRTAFASRAANQTVGWLAGVLSFYNSTYYPALAFGRTQQLPFVRDNARRRIAFSVSSC